MSAKDGGFAFPVEETASVNGQEGMTLRDWFAGQALTGIIGCVRDHTGASTVPSRSDKAFEYADAMLKEREK